MFGDGVAELEDGLQSFVSITSGLPDLAADVEHSVERYLNEPSNLSDVHCQSVVLYVLKIVCTDHAPLNVGRIVSGRRGSFVSTTELLRCHAYTECLLFVVLPKGIRIEGLCSPRRHYEVVLRIPIRSKEIDSREHEPGLLTPLGVNHTQVSELSRAFSQELSLRQPKGLSPPSGPPSPPTPSQPDSHPGYYAGHEDPLASVQKDPHPIDVDGARESKLPPGKHQCALNPVSPTVVDSKAYRGCSFASWTDWPTCWWVSKGCRCRCPCFESSHAWPRWI